MESFGATSSSDKVVQSKVKSHGASAKAKSVRVIRLPNSGWR